MTMTTSVTGHTGDPLFTARSRISSVKLVKFNPAALADLVLRVEG